VVFYNQGTKEETLYKGKAGAKQLLLYAAGLGCAKRKDSVKVREIDEQARMVYIAWEYPKPVSTFCGPSAEMYMFDQDYKISRMNSLLDWRLPLQHPTRSAFDNF